jgi:hypothetical protein
MPVLGSGVAGQSAELSSWWDGVPGYGRVYLLCWRFEWMEREIYSLSLDI